jgi:hypothetical protein
MIQITEVSRTRPGSQDFGAGHLCCAAWMLLTSAMMIDGLRTGQWRKLLIVVHMSYDPDAEMRLG